MISEATIEEIKGLDIVDVVSHYVDLKKSGSRFKGLSPFNHEKTPSFMVDHSGKWYDFSAGFGGNIITFIMKIENLTFPEAIEKLANMHGITVQYTHEPSPQISSAPLEIYKKWCVDNLKSRPDIIKYLNDRGVTNDTIERFEIGFSPSSREVVSFIRSSTIPEPTAIELGIIDSGDNGLYARFIDRIMFPIRDVSAKLCGFSGRTVKNHPAKYVNTKETPLFKKHKLIYGFNVAKESILKHKFFVLCEGQMDVVTSHQIGLHYTFATMGTSLTDSHVKIIKRFSSKGVIAYDGDRAGIDAAFKAAKLLMQEMVDVSVVIFDNDEDPADLVASNRGSDLIEMLKNGVSGIKFCLNRILLRYDLSNPFEKANAWKEVEAFAKDMRPVIARAIIEDASKVLGVVKTPMLRSQNKKRIGGATRELELIKYAVVSGDSEAITDILSIRRCFSLKDELAALERQEFDHESLSRIFLDESIHILPDFRNAILLFKQWCLKRFITAVRNSSTISPVDKLKKIREAQAKIEKIIKEEKNERKP
jgi:DNA primase